MMSKMEDKSFPNQSPSTDNQGQSLPTDQSSATQTTSQITQTDQQTSASSPPPESMASTNPPIQSQPPVSQPPMLDQNKPSSTVQPSIAQAPPPPPPTSSITTENPELKPPSQGGGIKKILVIIAILLAVVVGVIVVIQVLLPRLKNLQFPGQQVTLTYWGLWEPNTVMEDIISQFQEQNPTIKVEYVKQNHKEYRERLQSAIARGEGPDIFRFHNTWVPMFRDDLDKMPADVFSAQEFQNTFYPVAGNDLKVGSSFVGIPLEIDGLALVYNKKIFSNAGKTPPTTWEELRKTAFDLTVRDESGRLQTAGVALGTTGNIDNWSDILALMMFQNGANPSVPTDKFAADALLFYTLFSRSDKVWDSTMPNSTEAFVSGKVAMVFTPSWKILEIKALNQELEIGVVPVPKLPNSNISWASYWVEGVSAKSENKQQSWKFLSFLSQKDTMEKLFKAAAIERGFGEPYGRKDMAELLIDDPLLGAYISQAPAARSWYLSAFTHDNGINDRMIKYFEDAVNSVNNKLDAQVTLTRISQGVEQVLAQYKVQ